MKKRMLPGLMLLVCQPVLALDLVGTYEQALSYDSGIAAARASLEAQRAGIDVSRSNLLPQVSAFGDASYIDTSSATLDDDYTTIGYGLQLTQPLFRAQTWFRFENSQFLSEAAQAEYSLAQQQLILDVATAYFNVLRASDTLTTARATEAAIQRQYEQAQERYEVGLIAITEVYEARASYDDSKSQRIAAESNLDIAKERLARLTGDYPESVENLEQQFPLMRPEPMDPGAWERIALEQNWQIQSTLYELNANEATLRAAKAGHLPTLDLNASYGRTEISGLDQPGIAFQARSSGSSTTEGVVSLSLNVPLYLGGGVQAGARQQRSLVDVAEQTLRTVRRDVRVNVRSLYRTVNTNIESASALEQTIVSRRSALDATLAGYEVGTRNIVEVLDAQRNYYIALRDYANARYDYIINTLSLKLTAGTLSPQDLIALNEWLSPTAPGIEALANEGETLADPTAN